MKRTLDQYKARFDALGFANKKVKSCARREHIRDYIPGQVIYNLGEYPERFSIRPTEYDYNVIQTLSKNGVGLIQLHEEWNDAQRFLGADKYTSHDPEGLREFIKLCHGFGIKVLPYISTGFFDWRDPDFTERFSTNGVYELNSAHYRYRCCDAASPDWNVYLIPRLEKILDDYEFDGLYNDMGYGCAGAPEFGYLEYDPYFEDILSRVYTMVKKRGGIVKIHQGACLSPLTHTRVYDYLWVGECVRRATDLLETAAFDPYVIVNPDYRFVDEKNPDAFYAMAIPNLQFLLRVDGRPITGERAFVPGVEYVNNPGNNEQIHFERMRAWYREHPNGPYSYSEWSDIPDNVEARERWFDYLALYRPMVTEDSVAFVNLGENEIFREALPHGVYASLFVNEEVYLTLSNVGEKRQKIELADTWLNRRTGETVRTLDLGYGDLYFLKLATETKE